MDLHGDFAHADLCRDLLIHQTCSDKAYHLLFARSERLVKCLVLGTPYAVTVERYLDCVEEVLVAKRLGEKFYCSGLHSAYGHRDVAVTGDENDRNANAGFGEFGLKVEPTYPRQSDIEHEAGGRVGTDIFSRKTSLRSRKSAA